MVKTCNPVFIELGLRIGVDRFCDYFHKFGLMNLTGVDIPGEAGTIMHKKENIGQVELATISFGQSFQITPIQLAATVCSRRQRDYFPFSQRLPYDSTKGRRFQVPFLMDCGENFSRTCTGERNLL